jgi:hypothetical protein
MHIMRPCVPRGLKTEDIIAAIKEQPDDPDRHVYVLLHNIDGLGEMKRGERRWRGGEGEGPSCTSSPILCPFYLS